jgi:hypothetical protein
MPSLILQDFIILTFGDEYWKTVPVMGLLDVADDTLQYMPVSKALLSHENKIVCFIFQSVSQAKTVNLNHVPLI